MIQGVEPSYTIENHLILTTFERKEPIPRRETHDDKLDGLQASLAPNGRNDSHTSTRTRRQCSSQRLYPIVLDVVRELGYKLGQRDRLEGITNSSYQEPELDLAGGNRGLAGMI